MFHWNVGDDDKSQLRADEHQQPEQGGFHEAVGMQADAEHVGAEPGPAGDDVAADGQSGQAALADEAGPSRVQHEGVPEDDQHCAVFLWIPSPEAAPGLVGPDAAEDGADEGEEDREADDAVDHSADVFALVLGHRTAEDAFEDVENAQDAGEESGGVAEGDDDHVGGEPEIGVEHRLEHFHGMAIGGEVLGDNHGKKAGHGGGGDADAVAIEIFQAHSEDDDAPGDENGGGVQIRHGWAAGDVNTRQ